MPELPEVEIFKRYLDATSLHQRIDDVDVRNTYILKQNFSARACARIERAPLSNRVGVMANICLCAPMASSGCDCTSA